MNKFIKFFATIALLSLIFLSCGDNSATSEYTIAENGLQIITETTAKKFAVEKTKLNIDDVQYTNVNISNTDVGNKYDIEFLCDGYKYFVALDAVTGDLIDYHKELIDYHTPAISEIYKPDTESINHKNSRDESHISSEYVSQDVSQDFLEESSENISDISDEISSDSSDESNNIIDIEDPIDGSEDISFENSTENDISVDTDKKVEIGEDAAFQAALNKAELDIDRSALEYFEIDFDNDKNDFHYDIEFIYSGFKYDITVNAENGEIIQFEIEELDDNDKNKKPLDGESIPVNGNSPNKNEPPIEDKPENGNTPIEDNKPNKNEGDIPPTNEYMTEEDALQIALNHAQLVKSEISEYSIILDKEHGGIEYEIEFVSGYDEYDYDIDAITGEILNFDRETEFCSAPEISKPAPEDFISKETARNIAFKHAGVNVNDVFDFEIELDEHKGKFIYEIEFECGQYEYEYDIDALSGEVIQSNREMEDDYYPRTNRNNALHKPQNETQK